MTTQTATKATTGILGALAVIGGVFTEPREPAAATGLYTIGTIFLGVALAMAVIDWWRDRQGGDR